MCSRPLLNCITTNLQRNAHVFMFSARLLRSRQLLSSPRVVSGIAGGSAASDAIETTSEQSFLPRRDPEYSIPRRQFARTCGRGEMLRRATLQLSTCPPSLIPNLSSSLSRRLGATPITDMCCPVACLCDATSRDDHVNFIVRCGLNARRH